MRPVLPLSKSLMTDLVRRQGKRVVRLPCCPAWFWLVDDVAVARTATGRDEDCRLTSDVSVVGDGEFAVDRLSDGHDVEKDGCVFKGYVFHLTLLRLWLC